ncbi:ThuA domain-containing protein [Xanthomonas melonis]|uniref:ThuA domain-containing protein n=1 Tax=Xanthomonas melonis TaxID=56456 RepID=A0ABS8NUC9_9XANT|nr:MULTISPECIES: ThuA domain-containing protein [Xanthomonas]MCC4587582.1 ThuA domain-containing protein [Xanthomonas sp. NCPPB 1067]MCD0245038.1 ThuA domain-containing protein [Xanthomonas melonis]MCD0258460.1 ThuA domain-containing protein [Xanthomonas melonis]MCD0266681.1 ThuA domain-containing protein [Xanthomonas melonis]
MHRLLLTLICMLASFASTAASAPERMLIFSKTAGFRHESIPTAVATLRQLAAEEGMAADHSEDAEVFTADNLARYRVVAFASTTGEILAPAQQQAFEGFVRRGGGFLGVHSAADTGYQWPWYGQLVGAWFKGHPPGLQSTRVQPEREGQAVGKSWPITDEIYNYRHNPRGQVQVIATVDERLYAGGTMGADHPIAWCHAFDGGRAWYTGLGHDAAVYANAEFLAQLRQGLRYAAGREPGC